MDVCLLLVLCVLSGIGLCDGLITCPEESYQVWCVVECDLETSLLMRSWPTGGREGGCRAKKKTNIQGVTGGTDQTSGECSLC